MAFGRRLTDTSQSHPFTASQVSLTLACSHDVGLIEFDVSPHSVTQSWKRESNCLYLPVLSSRVTLEIRLSALIVRVLSSTLSAGAAT